MSTPAFNPRSPTMRRIMREAKELTDSPSPDYTAAPLDTDIFEWHFTIRGPPNSVYANGMYHGRIVLPTQYPLRPPNFRFTTPSGRFEVNREICLSISGFHEETWQPAWGIRTALVALRSFMETSADGQVGGLDATDTVKRAMAAESPGFRCATCRKTNAEIIAECEEAAAASTSTAAPVEVPDELKLAFKDQMGAAATAAAPPGEEADEEARLAEGFVQTVPESVPQSAPEDTQDDTAATAAAAQLHARLHAQNTAFAQQIQQQMQQQMQQQHAQILQQHHNQVLAATGQQQQQQNQEQAHHEAQAPNLQDYREPRLNIADHINRMGVVNMHLDVPFLQRNVVYAEDVPIWIDMAIAGLLCLLTTLMFKWGYLDRLLAIM